MNSILIVPTYNYLCDPLIHKVHEMFGCNNEFHWINLVESKASFGNTKSSGLPVVTSFTLKSKSLNGLYNIAAKKRLLKHLNSINPKHIVTFSDVTSFANFIKGSKFESRVIVIQPCLLDMRKTSWKTFILFILRRFLDKLVSRGGMKSRHAWGDTLLKATFLVWSDIERTFLEFKGRKVLVSGPEVYCFPHKKNVNKTHDVVVIAPHFNLYKSGQLVSEYFFTLMKIIDKMPEYHFKIKYHPANNVLIPTLSGVEVIAELDDIQLEEAIFVLCGYSNVAIMASFLNDSVFIMDTKYYSNPYINSNNFFIVDKDDLGDFYSSLDNKKPSHLTNYFVASDEFNIWRNSIHNNGQSEVND
jgi:hypothetical protein